MDGRKRYRQTDRPDPPIRTVEDLVARLDVLGLPVVRRGGAIMVSRPRDMSEDTFRTLTKPLKPHIIEHAEALRAYFADLDLSAQRHDTGYQRRTMFAKLIQLAHVHAGRVAGMASYVKLVEWLADNAGAFPIDWDVAWVTWTPTVEELSQASRADSQFTWRTVRLSMFDKTQAKLILPPSGPPYCESAAFALPGDTKPAWYVKKLAQQDDKARKFSRRKWWQENWGTEGTFTPPEKH